MQHIPGRVRYGNACRHVVVGVLWVNVAVGGVITYNVTDFAVLCSSTQFIP